MKKIFTIILVSFTFVGCNNNSLDIDKTISINQELEQYSEQETLDTLIKLNKSEIENIDTEISEKNMDIIDLYGHAALMISMKLYFEGNISKDDMINMCKSVSRDCKMANESFLESEVTEDYIENSKSFYIQVQKEANLIEKYINGDDINDFQEIKEQILLTKNLLSALLDSRITFLNKNGFTEEEIAMKIEDYKKTIEVALYVTTELQTILN